MTRILFVCLGNICRSPMAEFIMKDMAKKAGLADRFEIASAATSREEIGNPVYQPLCEQRRFPLCSPGSHVRDSGAKSP